MEIFISWSGARSKAFAVRLSQFIERVLHPVKPWMSTKIDPGSRWFQEIGNRLSENTIGIICVTPENLESPWLLFEAGAISKVASESHVIPLLIGLEINELDGPFKQFQAKAFTKNDLYSVISFLNSKLENSAKKEEFLKEDFDLRWDNFIGELDKDFKFIGLRNPAAFGSILRYLRSSGLPEPESGKTVYYSEGFESHTIYNAVSKFVQNRLWILGRKNRKLFDKNYINLFSSISDKDDIGLDFRCLFLSPNASKDIIYSAHQSDGFYQELCSCIDNAKNLMRKCNVSPSKHFRSYKHLRSHEVIVVDDVILFSPITYDASGRAKVLTKSSFKMTTVYTSEGSDIVNEFMEIWNAGEEL